MEIACEVDAVGDIVDSLGELALNIFHQDDLGDVIRDAINARDAPLHRLGIDRQRVAKIIEEALQLQRIFNGKREIDFHDGLLSLRLKNRNDHHHNPYI